MNLETRQYKVRATAGSDGRTLTGLAVPYDTPTEIVPGFNEIIARGAIDLAARPSLFYRHGEPIGVVTDMTDTADGLEITARISDTSQGRDAATLVADGAITALSIGFFEREWQDVETHEGFTRTQTKIDLREISLVPIPAYDDAQITSIRQNHHHHTQVKENHEMADSTITLAQVDNALTEAVQPLAARLAALETITTAPAAPAVETRSAGQLITAAANDENARAALEHYALRAAPAVTTTADGSFSVPNFIGDLTRIISVANPLMQLFSTGTLPATGNVLEYTQLKENTLTVSEQATEGAALPTGAITTEMIQAARVKTYGGATTISRQAIDRSPANILDLQLRGLALAAGKQLANDFVTHFMAAVKTQEAKAISYTKSLATWGWSDVLAMLLDAHARYEDNAMKADGLIVDRSTYQAIAGLTDKSGRPLFTVAGNVGANNIGTISASGRYADLDGLKVIMANGITASSGKMGTSVAGAFYTADAIRTYASPVASLQDTNVLDLTGAFSVYYYAAFATEIPYGLVPLKVTA